MIHEHTFKSGDEMLAAMVVDTVTRLEEAIATRGHASMAVAGGRFPQPLFRKLSAVVLDWEKVTITLGDDRWVGVDDDQSNEKLVRDNLLIDKAAAATFVSLKTGHDSPEDAVADLNDRLATQISWPLDIVYLGMGDDGHTASLFPSSAPDDLKRGLYPEKGELVAAARPAVSPVPRISMTLPALLNARYIGIHITGQSKWSTYETAKNGNDIAEMPVRGILKQTDIPVDLWWSAENPKG
ncbi:6-phosphogluconolactonase [Thalassospira sp.]|uniref:6-phosphogluconolactonase n=1 Tax=Thalassospira sp. TaxID=1912094 RepID=UPI0027365254|nr:6-phosphogluconolactonase [Thalassospira sp.]MDP2697395.1 6-phosphogluconolactonase [Thalassospira sp.]